MSRIVTKSDVVRVIDEQLIEFIGKTRQKVDNDLLKIMILDAVSTELTVRMPLTFTWKVGCELTTDVVGFDALVTVEVISLGAVSTTIQRRYSEAYAARYEIGGP
ncbi:hypothetical protein EVB87_193 [Rhizobium phage RHph_N28_1]|nr:hypothetical protein EVB87_193 [Rhizobium phage RHph_N28_1]QIG74222.1 hypothetical protein EVC07_194 [Rhizobium phage RHph_N42]QIG74830.1 hypothetical protein EVC12_195 [Rhizobium phage RHph_I42]QXV73882.1 hypothetical protein [Rhizobium phage RHph_N46]